MPASSNGTSKRFGFATWPVVAETWSGYLSDIDGFHVTARTAMAALDAARPGPVEEGNVGGGTGMVCFGFKGGIGTASRVVSVGGKSLYGRRARPVQHRRSQGAADCRRAGRARRSPSAGCRASIRKLAAKAEDLPPCTPDGSSGRAAARPGLDHHRRRHRCAADAATSSIASRSGRRWASRGSVPIRAIRRAI